MKTLIELYDPSPIRNVLSTVMFRPEEMILLCPPESVDLQELKRSLHTFFEHLKCQVKLTILPVSLLDAGKIERALREVLDSHPDCAIDISGGTDAALFATGAVSGETSVFTYSAPKNTFYEIRNAPFARGLPCSVRLDVASCLMMVGGTLLPGRADNAPLLHMFDRIDHLFDIYSKFRREWNAQISYIQKISSTEPGALTAEGPLAVQAGNNKTVDANIGMFDSLAGAGLIEDLSLSQDRIRFRFADEKVRFWLRDIGSILELQVFRACHAAGCFDDVVLSAVVNWQDGALRRDSVFNEIDVMAVQGIQPVFISCKTCEISTDALNELAILRGRFGGKYSRAILATSAVTTKYRAPMRSRAARLGIELIEWDDLSLDKLVSRLRREV